MFFFQAEDGIRYLVRSRGLGDVYKRQGFDRHVGQRDRRRPPNRAKTHSARGALDDVALIAVSYTHLTLPTSDLV